jgi:hypothetical protein
LIVDMVTERFASRPTHTLPCTAAFARLQAAASGTAMLLKLPVKEPVHSEL